VKKTTKIIIALAVAVVLIAVASFLVFKDFFQNNKNSGFENEVAEEYADSSKEEASSDITAGGEEEKEDVKLKSNNENEIQTQSSSADKEDENNSTSPEENEESSESSSSASGNESLEDLQSEYEKILKSGKPSIIVFSYDADCCASTKKFFNDYNKKALGLMEDYQDRFDTLFINTGILNEKDMNTALDIVSKNEVTTLPSILILNSAGEAYEVIGGPFEESLVKNILEGMEK